MLDPLNIRNKDKLLPEHILRMAEEIRDLVPRLNNLSHFIDSNKVFKDLTAQSQHLLVQQRGSMEEYAKTLCLRHIMAILDQEKQ